MVVSADFRPCQSSVTEDPENRKPNRRGERRYTFSPKVKQTDKVWTLLLLCFPSCREKELAKVTIKKEDVELIVSAPLYSKHFSSTLNKALMVWFCGLADVGDGDLAVCGRAQSAGTPWECGGGSGCSDQLIEEFVLVLDCFIHHCDICLLSHNYPNAHIFNFEIKLEPPLCICLNFEACFTFSFF